MKKFDYPKILDKIFDKLNKNNIKPLIIGGYVRDYFLHLHSKDIDIELYNASSLTQVIKILENFGSVNCVGKSFAVIKLHYEGYALDFSLPRKDNKVAPGHKGFVITVDNTLSFEEASKRRDFTINAMAYDVIEKKLLDPHHGRQDLKKRCLRAVDLSRFAEDPLRLLRAVGFASRFDFHIDKKLFVLMQKMVQIKALDELPKERVFEEIKKIFLKAKKPSIAFYLLDELSFKEFGMNELFKLQKEDLQQTLQSLDNFSKIKKSAKDETEVLIIMLALLVQKLPDPQSFLLQLTNNKKILKEVLQLHELSFDLNTEDRVAIAKLAKKINIRRFTLYLEALYPHKEEISHLREEAKKIGVYEKALPALVNGDDLIKKGLKPSKDFQKILTALYNKQLEEDIQTKEELLSFVEVHPSYF
jgi:tRNA nucleotidyltransferase (CCA-adding enzyme)